MIVDFEHPCLQFLVNKQVKAQDLKGLADHIVATSHCVNLMFDQGSIDLHYSTTGVIDAGLYSVYINAALSKRMPQRAERALSAFVVRENVAGGWVNVGIIGLVDRVVSQVHESLFEVRFYGCRVASLFKKEQKKLRRRLYFNMNFTYCAESCQSLIANIRFDRIKTHYYNVDAKVKLDTIEE